MKKDYRNVILISLFVFVLCVSINVYADNVSCTGVFDYEFLSAMNDYVYVPIKWATPIIFIILTSVDFAKVVFGGKKEQMDKAKNNFLKRFVAAFIVFFAPDVLIMIANLANPTISSCLDMFK